MNSWLGKPQGFFKLSESDKYVGSYISGEDIKIIFGVNDSIIQTLPLNKKINAGFIDEKKLRRLLKKENTLKAKVPYANRASLDEYFIAAIVKQCYPKAEIVQQYNWIGKKTADLYISVNNRIFVLEFLGPDHFVDSNKLYSDLKRKDEIEKIVKGSSCILWPYWIQRCALNVRILFGDEKQKNGRGALWSSKCYFGDHVINNASHIICELTKPFRAALDGSYGLFYDGSTTEEYIKPEHFIINDIISGKEDYHFLIPKDVPTEEEDKWLPSKVIEWKKNK
jgi:hypothetical protein